MSRPAADLSVYFVTDSALCAPRGVPETARLAALGGAGVVQVREKHASTREFIDLARAVKNAIADTGALLLINDRVDVALAVGADGAHVGQSDMPYDEARRILGPDALIGLSVETMDQAREAEGWDVGYLGVSPLFDTPTKTDTAPAWGLDGLAELRRTSHHRLVAIGGINAANAADAARAGAHGVAVVSAICTASDPQVAARELRVAVCGALRSQAPASAALCDDLRITGASA
ncbi:thiamine phosphate synthase [Desulfocurvus sp. DL9XJH121]